MKVEVVRTPIDQNNRNGSDQVRELLEGEPGYLHYKWIPPGDDFYIKNYF